VDGSSQALQAEFFTDFMTNVPALLAAAGHPLRAASAFELVDMENCAAEASYYNISSPGFIEYLCTLGMVSAVTGAPKEAFSAFLKHVRA